MTGSIVRYTTAATVTLLLTGLTGCCTAPELPREVDDALVDWLECEGCVDDEFDNLTDYCEDYVASRLALIATEGPPPEILAAYRDDLRARYQRRANYAAATPGVDPPAITEDEYVEMYAVSLVNRQKARAFAALKEVSRKKSPLEWLDEAPSAP
jgi:hypothetical protein